MHGLQDGSSRELGVPSTGNPVAVVLTVRLVSFEADKESWEYTDDDEKFEAAEARKALGNHKVKSKDYARALRRYESAKVRAVITLHL